MFELSDDGQEVVSGEIPLHLDGFGNIINPRNPEEKTGYLIGNDEPKDGELYITMEGLLAPVPRVESRQEPLKVLRAEPPSQDEQERYYG